MTKEQQNKAWACLPKEVRDELKYRYSQIKDYSAGRAMELSNICGLHNLTSDTEPEEMLMVERKKAQEIFHQIKLELGDGGCSEYQDDINMEKENLLKSLFGDKCLPDKEPMKIDCADDLEAMFKDELPDLIKKKYRFEVGDIVVFHPFKTNHFYNAEVIEIKKDADKPYALKLEGAENIWAYPIEVQSIEETYPSVKEGDKVLEALEEYRNTATLEQKAAALAKLESECLPDKEEQAKPKFKLGDKVVVKSSPHICRIVTDYHLIHCTYGLDHEIFDVKESELEPYTEEKNYMEENLINDPDISYDEVMKKKIKDMDEKEKKRCGKCGANTQQCMDAPCQDYPPYIDSSKKIVETNNDMEEKELDHKALYKALYDLESASVKVRKALVQFQNRKEGER